MARMLANRSDLAPMPVDLRQVLGYVVLWAVLMTALCGLLIAQNIQLTDKVSVACATTGAAAKLDLSSFVPLCKEVPR